MGLFKKIFGSSDDKKPKTNSESEKRIAGPNDWLAIAHRQIEEGDYELGINLLKELEEEIPNNYNMYYLLGVAYQRTDNFVLAEINYKKAIDLKPNHFDAFLGLGITFQKQSQFSEAIKCLEEAINIDRNFVDAYNSLGYTYKLKGDIQKAIEVYTNGIDVLFENIYYHILNNQEFIDEEIVAEKFKVDRWFETATKTIVQYAGKDGFVKIRFPTPETVVNLKENNPYGSKLFIDNGDVRTILPNMNNNFADKLSLNIQYANFMNNIGTIYLELGDTELARDYVIEAIIFTPKNVEFLPPLYNLDILTNEKKNGI